MFTRVRDYWRRRRLTRLIADAPPQPAHNYWDRQMIDPEKRDRFMSGIGNETAPGRLEVRAHVFAAGFRSLLDVGCGPAIDSGSYRRRLRYVALDFADVWRISAAANRVPFVKGSVEALPFRDGTFDATYARAVLEHRPYYHDGMRELVRVAAREAIIVFFRLREDADLIRPDPENFIHHNNYARAGVERFTRSLPGVRSVRWQDVPGLHHILHVSKV